MDMLTISQVSKEFSVSTRTLRYYEKIGILHSARIDGYAYRVYDDMAVKKLRQIIFLRKLRMPLKEIATVLDKENSKEAAKIFENMLRQINSEIESLSTIRKAIKLFVDNLDVSKSFNADILTDEQIISLVETLIPSEYNFKEVVSMQEINKADEGLSKLKNVRIVYLPPETVAAAQYEGDDPEYHVGKMMNSFVRSVKLWEIKPDARHFGFNNPQPTDESNHHGYEMWITIPDDMDVPAPMEKKQFKGGMYAAHSIKMGNFHEWGYLDEWVRTNGKYVYGGNTREARYMFGSLEESLNYFYALEKSGSEEYVEMEQLDLLIPVIEVKENK